MIVRIIVHLTINMIRWVNMIERLIVIGRVNISERVNIIGSIDMIGRVNMIGKFNIIETAILIYSPYTVRVLFVVSIVISRSEHNINPGNSTAQRGFCMFKKFPFDR